MANTKKQKREGVKGETKINIDKFVYDEGDTVIVYDANGKLKDLSKLNKQASEKE